MRRKSGLRVKKKRDEGARERESGRKSEEREERFEGEKEKLK